MKTKATPKKAASAAKLALVQIAASNGVLYGLDRAGQVWTRPATDPTAAPWTAVTVNRAGDPVPALDTQATE